ncbi:NPCBM/NEW2 domain-containing protein [Paenibacillus ferrarius]|uniref:NPCBM/NEW2 domain-containing protein n=1 Tax=Paenibacillus ferrarius TaxID=1469647 RepID=UPI003D2E109F
MKLKDLKGFLVGFSCCALLSSGVAYASYGGTQIEVFYKKLQYAINGTVLESLDGQGFIFEGSTYVPLRMVSEALDKEVKWDGTTNTIRINDKVTKLTSDYKVIETKSLLDIWNNENLEAIGFLARNTWGQKHNTAVNAPALSINNVTYKKGFGLYLHDNPYPAYLDSGGSAIVSLMGEYNRFTAEVGADHSVIKDTAEGTLKIYGDGKLLETIPNIKAGQAAKKINIDVTDVKSLIINFNSDRNGLINMIIGNPEVSKVAPKEQQEM